MAAKQPLLKVYIDVPEFKVSFKDVFCYSSLIYRCISGKNGMRPLPSASTTRRLSEILSNKPGNGDLQVREEDMHVPI